MAPEERRDGWPTLSDVHSAVLRVDGRLEVIAQRQDAQARELAEHKIEKRRELDQLGQGLQDQRDQINHLRTWRGWITGALAVLGLIMVGLVFPVIVRLFTRGVI